VLPTASPCDDGAPALGGSYMLLLPEAPVELLRSVPCRAVEELVSPEGETGSGVDAASADRVGCTVLPAGRAASPPGFVARSQAAKFREAPIAKAIAHERCLVMLLVSKPSAHLVSR
jgi:hypothetical protein